MCSASRAADESARPPRFAVAPETPAGAITGRRFLVLHRVPLSEDGGLSSMFLASSDSVLKAEPETPLLLTEPVHVHGGGGDSLSGIRVVPDSSVVCSAAALQQSRFADFSAPSGASSSASLPAARHTLDDSSEGGRFIPVGFTVIDLAILPNTGGSSVGFSGGLLAAAADNGVIFVLRLGSNAVLRRLVGHSVTSELAAGTRISWWPVSRNSSEEEVDGLVGRRHGCSSHYLIASSDRDFSAVVYSLGAQSVVSRLGLGQPIDPAFSGRAVIDGSGEDCPRQTRGHTASIKAVVSATRKGSSPLLLTAGFDKRVVVWI